MLSTEVCFRGTGSSTRFSPDWALRASTRGDAEHRKGKDQVLLWIRMRHHINPSSKPLLKEFGKHQSKLWLNPLRMNKRCCIQTFGSLQGKKHRECSKEFPVSNESKQCIQGALKIIAERALSFCSVRFWVFYLPITKLHDFSASLIKQLIDAGAL